MKRPVRMIVMVVAALVFVTSGIMLGRQFMEYHAGGKDYDEAENIANLPADLPTPPPVRDDPLPSGQPYVDPVVEALAEVDLDALRETNDDVIGWITIPGSEISYPVVQGLDNDYYLEHTWKGSRNSVGAIFLDYRCDDGMKDFHSIIYGHRMNNRSMFHSLHDFRDQSYVDTHPSIYLVTDDGVYRYDIFAVYEAEVDGHTYRRELPDEGLQQEFLDYCMERSVVETGVTPQPGEHILTLSTCVNGSNNHETRWVVQAVRPAQPEIEPE